MSSGLGKRMASKKNALLLTAAILSLGSSDLVSDELPYEPTKLGTPPANAFRSLWRAGDGSIQSFGFTGTFREPTGLVSLVSRDEGRSWATEKLSIVRPEGREDPFFTYIPPGLKQDPNNGDWLAIIDGKEPYLLRWEGDPWKVVPKAFPITERGLIMMRPPIFIRKGKRILAAGHHLDPNPIGGRTSIYHSDDGGLTWGEAHLLDAPHHRIEPPHKGLRWQNPGVEPTIVELKDGRLWCLLRTSQDRHYETYSNDGGESWSSLQPSPFWGTLTMKTFHRLPDGRLLFVWTNATPLPERPHSERVQGIKDWETGREDVFTNRDTLHAAISDDDGASWRGFREILINELRNEPDFGTSHGGVGPSNDRSVHQAQVIDLDDGRVLVQAGQHPALRSLLAFHPDWLLEKERSDDFSNGLEDWHVQLFRAGVVGHCAYNREAGAALVEDPTGRLRRVLRVRNLPDAKLVSSTQGALWNFPLGRKGSLETSIFIPKGSKGGVLALNDRWLAPSDNQLERVAPILLSFDSSGQIEGTDLRLHLGEWNSLSINWNWDQRESEIVVGSMRRTIPFSSSPILDSGFSYLHLQSSREEDPIGFLIGPVSAQVD